MVAALANNSPRQVTALVARWTFTDADGDTQVRHNVVDDYFVYNRFPSLTSGRSVLVTPRGCLEPMMPGSRWCFVGTTEAPEASAVAATLDIDSAVFEGGRIVGPDKYDIGVYIHGRHTAAVALLDEVRAAEEAGEDPGDSATADQQAHFRGFAAPRGTPLAFSVARGGVAETAA